MDLSAYRSGDWYLYVQNPETRQNDSVLISSVGPEVEEKSQAGKAGRVEDGWKWTDVLVVFMAVNFLAIVGYQIVQSNNDGKAKVH